MIIKKSQFLIFLIFTVIIVLSGLRIDGPDYLGYLSYYNRYDNIYNYITNFNFDLTDPTQIEPLFFGSVYLLKTIGFSFNLILTIISIIISYFLIKIINTSNFPIFTSIFVVLLVTFYFNFWYIRQGLGNLLALSYFFKSKEKKNITHLILAVLIHKSSLILILTIYIINLIKNFKWIFLFGSLILYFLDIELFFINSDLIIFKEYLKYEGVKLGISIIPFFLYTFYNEIIIKNKSANYQIITNFTIGIIILICIFGDIPLLGRFTGISLMLCYAISTSTLTFNKKNIVFDSLYTTMLISIAIKEFISNYEFIQNLKW